MNSWLQFVANIMCAQVCPQLVSPCNLNHVFGKLLFIYGGGYFVQWGNGKCAQKVFPFCLTLHYAVPILEPSIWRSTMIATNSTDEYHSMWFCRSCYAEYCRLGPLPWVIAMNWPKRLSQSQEVVSTEIRHQSMMWELGLQKIQDLFWKLWDNSIKEWHKSDWSRRRNNK